MASRLSDQVFLVGSMDVNIPVTRVGVGRLQAIEPQNPGEHAVLLPAWNAHLSGRHTALEHRPLWSFGTKSFPNPEFSQRGFEAAGFGSQTKF